jgi:hypothetical protein
MQENATSILDPVSTVISSPDVVSEDPHCQPENQSHPPTELVTPLSSLEENILWKRFFFLIPCRFIYLQGNYDIYYWL